MPAVVMASQDYPLDESTKAGILHLGEPIAYDLQLLARLESQFRVIPTSAADLQRAAFLDHLRKKTWGDFVGIMRPFWNTGGEMGKWDREVIELLPRKLKVYASAGAGYDWVDTNLLAEHGIVYCNSRGASTEAVADSAIFHIISVFRCMMPSQLAARSLDPDQFWDAHYNLPVISHNPRNHTLGIIGLGDIGFAIAIKARAAFGMRILYNDIKQKSEEQERAVSAIFYPRLQDMLAESDCVLLATPFAGEQLITAETLSYFKPGARFVNIARGSLVDEEALANALDVGKLTAVGTDVHQHEPHPNRRLATNKNVTMTCHNGGGALETIKGFERMVMENVDAVLNGREPLSAVNLDKIKQPGRGHEDVQHDGTNGHVSEDGHDYHDNRSDGADGHSSNGHVPNGIEDLGAQKTELYTNGGSHHDGQDHERQD